MAFRTALMIWLIAVVSNSLLVTILLGSDLASDVGTGSFFGNTVSILLMAFGCSLVFSLPALILLSIGLSICMNSNMRSFQLKTMTVVIAILLTAGTYFSIMLMFGGSFGFEVTYLLFIPLISVGIGIGFQWKALDELSSDNFQTDSHEN